MYSEQMQSNVYSGSQLAPSCGSGGGSTEPPPIFAALARLSYAIESAAKQQDHLAERLSLVLKPADSVDPNKAICPGGAPRAPESDLAAQIRDMYERVEHLEVKTCRILARLEV